jgi:uncharacterized protein with NRDE domain
VCTIAFAWQTLSDVPIAVAANRDEALDRESVPPKILETEPTVVAPQDAEAGGTWIGVTERGLLVAITNRYSKEEGAPDLPAGRSRGLLVRDALRTSDAEAAVELVRQEVAERAYAGFNLLVADADDARYLEWDGNLRVEALHPGVHVIVNPGKNDADDRAVRLRDDLAVDGGGEGEAGDADAPIDAGAWLDRAADRLSDHDYEVCLHRDEFGTRSSSLLSIAEDGRTTFSFADGPPCQTSYAPVDLPASFLDRRG